MSLSSETTDRLYELLAQLKAMNKQMVSQAERMESIQKQLQEVVDLRMANATEEAKS